MENGTIKQLALTVALGLLGSSGLHAQQVKIFGDVNAPEENREAVKMSVVTLEGDTVWQKQKRHPRFKVKLPADQVYHFVFEQPGSINKTVEIDAHHAVRPYTRKGTRPINFEVLMESAPEEHQFSGPVGKMDFSERTGRMYVEYDYSLQPIAEQRDTSPRDTRRYD